MHEAVLKVHIIPREAEDLLAPETAFESEGSADLVCVGLSGIECSHEPSRLIVRERPPLGSVYRWLLDALKLVARVRLDEALPDRPLENLMEHYGDLPRSRAGYGFPAEGALSGHQAAIEVRDGVESRGR